MTGDAVADPGIELVWGEGGVSRTRRFSSGRVTLGRGPENDVRVLDKSASRHHATITCEGDRWVLRDEGSANGTWLDGQACREAVLGDGARVRIGGVDIRCNVHSVRSLEAAADAYVADDFASEVTGRLEVDDFQTLVEHVLKGDSGEGAPHAVTQAEAEAPEGAPIASAAAVVALMRTATDALLEQENLDATLRVVIDLVFQHVPVDRGVILLLGDTGELVPAVRRAREGDDEEIRISSSIARTAVDECNALLVEDASSDERFGDAISIAVMHIRSAMCAPLCHEGRVVGLIYVDRISLDGAFERPHLELLSLLASVSAAAVERARMRDSIDRERALRRRLSRYSAPNVVEHLMRTAGDADALAVEDREVTVLFGDLAGFTTLSESLPARQVTALLNEVFGILTEEVFREAGTLDKFIGDAVMAFWGAPLDQPDHAQRAVRAALAMQRRLAERNARGPAISVEMRIGVNTGPAIVGDVGAPDRRDYTVIGDTVNVASRLESHVARIGEVIVGPATQQRIAGAFRCTPLKEIRLKGKHTACVPYRVDGAGDQGGRP